MCYTHWNNINAILSGTIKKGHKDAYNVCRVIKKSINDRDKNDYFPYKTAIVFNTPPTDCDIQMKTLKILKALQCFFVFVHSSLGKPFLSFLSSAK